MTKTVAEGSIRAAVAAGCQQFRENRVQEAKVKWRSLADSPISWSISGHLQTNKVKDVVAFGQEFQALDSIRVAEAMSRPILRGLAAAFSCCGCHGDVSRL